MTDAERIAALIAGYQYMSDMVWKFCDMSYIEDYPEEQAMLDLADEACSP